MGKDREREWRSDDRKSDRSRRDRDRDHHKDEVRSSRDRERERDYDKDRERDRRDRDRDERSRDHHRDRDHRDRHRDHREHREHRDRHRDREKRERSKHEEDDDERDTKRVRKDEEPKRAPSMVEDEKELKKRIAEAEQIKLNEDAEKRRRRVQEWQEQKRKEEEERKKKEEEEGKPALENGKAWTLEGESDEEGDSPKEQNEENGDASMAEADQAPNEDVNVAVEPMEEEVDPLDAFMNAMVIPEVKKLEQQPVAEAASTLPNKKMEPESDNEAEEDEEGVEEDDEEFIKRVKKTKAEKLAIVDHSKVDYAPFRKNLYKEVKEIQRMTQEDVIAYRKQLELKVRGKDVPKPIKTWNQTGLNSRILEMIKKFEFEKPMAIQAQALPVIMSGRDCIGIAKTGSGKTLAFVLPMLRHIKDQAPLEQGDGPIGLVMAPTRELVQQIHSDIKKFARVLGLTCVPVYGGSGVAQQISELKRGVEIVVCTPGRMIDILCTSAGKITNLKRVSYLVVDEADRMFDMGFEPQITKIVQNTRPDRQTVLFSATFPKSVELLARKVLDRPVEIQVGGRSVVNKDITQIVEVRPENERFLRLLELLGEWYVKGKVLVFVDKQDKCDALFRDLIKAGYACLSLHGAKDQMDRESTLSDFKSNVCNLLVATSVAARGLDVKDLELVVNFDTPNHYEDYVHRVGRTGRAGKKGHAVTFISPDDERYAPDLVQALTLSEQPVPEDLQKLADSFLRKVKSGSEKVHGSGFGGSGFKFNEAEEEAIRQVKKAQAKEYGFEEDEKSDSEEDRDPTIRKAGTDAANQAIGNALSHLQAQGVSQQMQDAANKAKELAKQLQKSIQKLAQETGARYEAELEINDFPQHARWKVTHKDALGQINDFTGAAITTRGQYIPPGKNPGPGERKLYLFIEGPNENAVRQAKVEIKRILEESTSNMVMPPIIQPGKYSVL